MDLVTLEGTSTYAIEAVYRYFWDMIPHKYKLPEDDERVKDLFPFYDPELDFENRLHYKISKVDYPNRAKPWFVITWNTREGLLKSNLTQRRFDTAVVRDPQGHPIKFQFTRVDLYVDLCITCNSMQALFELQENFILKNRNKIVCYTKPHSVLGKFPVCMDVINTNQTKMSKDRGTLCSLMMQVMVDYPVIGCLRPVHGGIIEQIDMSYYGQTEATQYLGTDQVGETKECSCEQNDSPIQSEDDWIKEDMPDWECDCDDC